MFKFQSVRVAKSLFAFSINTLFFAAFACISSMLLRFLFDCHWYFSIRCARDIGWFWNTFFSSDPWFKLCAIAPPTIFATSLLIAAATYLSRPKTFMRSNTHNFLLQDFKGFRFLICVISTLVVIFSSAVTCYVGVRYWRYAVLDTAYGLDYLGFYELGERVHSLARNGKYSLLANSIGNEGHDADRQEISTGRINNAVAAIYGARSPQMAWRLQIFARHVYQNFDDRFLAFKSYKQAVDIFQSNGDTQDAILSIGEAASIAAEISLIQEAQHMIDFGLSLNLSPTERRELAEFLLYTAREMKDRERTSRLEALLEAPVAISKAKPIKAIYQNSVDPFWPIGLGAICIIFILYRGKRHYLHRARRHWLAQLHINEVQLDNLPATIALYERLIAWHMFKRQYDEADRFSRAMLLAAER